jgi:hypothetical protein
MLVQSGTTVRRTTGVAAGGLGKRRGGGVHSSTSITKSGLVSSYAIPQRPQGFVFIVGMLVGVVASLTLILAIVGIPLAIYCYKQFMKMPARVQTWKEEMERFYNLWVCKKCGHEWTPEVT